MVTYNMEVKNTGPILADLLTAIHSFNAEEHVYVSRRISEDQPAASAPGLTLGAFGIRELPLPGILDILGIRSLTLNSIHDLEALFRLDVIAPATVMEKHVWGFFKDD